MTSISGRSVFRVAFAITAVFILFTVTQDNTRVSAYSGDDLLSRQSETAGIEEIFYSLPSETQEKLMSLGIDPADVTSASRIQISDVFGSIYKMFSQSMPGAIGAAGLCMGMMLLCALSQGMDPSLGSRQLKSVISLVGSLCLCTVLCVPLCSLAEKCAYLIDGCCNFMFVYIPVLASVLAFSGNAAAAASYYASVSTAAQFASVAAAKTVIPLTNSFLALSFGASLAPDMKLTPLCLSVYKIGVRILCFVMGIFTAVLSAQTLVTASIDNVSKKALRFAVGTFVPVVGSVLSETVSAFGGSLELLRRGAGVLVIISSGGLVLPVLIECIVWQTVLGVLSSSANILSLSVMGSMLESAALAVRMLTALLLCMLALFIISTVTVIVAAT